MSIDVLIEKIKKTENPSVAGLDPRLEFIPQYIRNATYERYGKTLEGAAEAIWEFNKGLIDALYDVVPAVKPQSAFYEMYGLPGEGALHKTVKYAREKGLYIILDVKRNDIGTTAQAYSSAYIGRTEVDGELADACPVDCVTVNPYLGTDGVRPFVDDCKIYGKAIFALVKTSNPSSGELQDKLSDGKPFYEHVAELVNVWNEDTVGRYGYGAVGAVVGATYPEQAKVLREIMKHSYFLVPGYGAQGGGARDVKNSFNDDGLGAIVNSSRGIMCAYKKDGWKEEQFAEAARAEAIRMRDEICSVL
jgi:orotidine-5'-phosphate decarboxylase